jgi:hypothetical protein
LNAPYVEIKLWCPPDQLSSQKKYFDEVEERLKDWIVLRDDEDPWEELWARLRTLKRVSIYDEASEGLLTGRLARFYRGEISRENLPELTLCAGPRPAQAMVSSTADAADFFLHAGALNDAGVFELTLTRGKRATTVTRKSPFIHRRENERSRLAAAELSAIAALEFLKAKGQG